MTTPLLRIESLDVAVSRRGHSTQVLFGVGLEVGKGERVGLIGESGGGKSMTLKSVMGMLPGSARIMGGRIEFEGRELTTLTPGERDQLKGTEMALIVQDPLTSFSPLFTIEAQFGDILRAVDRRRGGRESAHSRRLRMRTALASVRLPDPDRILEAYSWQLSGGMRQRVLIAMALVHRPKLLIADELGSALDVTTQQEILSLINGLVDEEQLSLLLITHNLALVRQLCERAYVMEHGRIVEHGQTEQLFANPTAPATRRLLAAVPPLYGPDVHTEVNRTAVDAMLRIDAVSRRFERRHGLFEPRRPPILAVKEASVTINRHDILGIAGESGSGKTTLARMILGLISPSAGSITFDGRDIGALAGDRTFRRRVQIVYQNPASSLNPSRTVAETIEVPLRFAKFGDRARRRARIAELLSLVELPQVLASRHPRELSGGQQQRVAIARALTLEPELLVLDEPTSALDASVQKVLVDLLLQLHERLGLTYVFISHDLGLMRNFCNRIAVMFRGEICEQGPTEELFDQPRHPYTRILLSAVPVLSDAEERAKPIVSAAERQNFLSATA